MTVKIGAQTSWQYILEDTRENPTSSGVPFRLPGIISGGQPLGMKFNPATYRGLSAPGATDSRAPASVQTSKNDYDWSVTYIPVKRISSPKYHILHFLGCVLNSTSGTAAGGAWTFGTGVTTALRTFTIFKEIDNLQHRLSGCVINRLTVKAALDTPVEIEAQGIGTTSSYADLSRTDATTLRDATPFMWSDVAIYIDGSLATNCTAFELNINNAAENLWTLGDKEPQQAIVKSRVSDVVITRQYQDIAQYADAKNNAAKAVTVRLTDTSGDTIDFRLRGGKWDSHDIPEAPIDAGVLVHQLRYVGRDIAAE